MEHSGNFIVSDETALGSSGGSSSLIASLKSIKSDASEGVDALEIRFSTKHYLERSLVWIVLIDDSIPGPNSASESKGPALERHSSLLQCNLDGLIWPLDRPLSNSVELRCAGRGESVFNAFFLIVTLEQFVFELGSIVGVKTQHTTTSFVLQLRHMAFARRKQMLGWWSFGGDVPGGFVDENNAMPAPITSFWHGSLSVSMNSTQNGSDVRGSRLGLEGFTSESRLLTALTILVFGVSEISDFALQPVHGCS